MVSEGFVSAVEATMTTLVAVYWLPWLSLEGQMQPTAAAANSQWVFQTPVDLTLWLCLSDGLQTAIDSLT